MPIPLTGVVGYTSTSNADGSQPIAPLGKYGELLLSELHGKYYTHTYRGRMFAASQATTAVLIAPAAATLASFALYNPIGSGVNLVLVRFEMWVQTDPGTPIVGGYGLYVNTVVQAAATTGTALTTQSCLLGSGVSSKGVAFTSATCPSNPVYWRAVANKQTGASTTIPYMPTFFIDFDGTAIMAPNTTVSLQQDAGDTTNSKACCTMVWYEAPV